MSDLFRFDEVSVTTGAVTILHKATLSLPSRKLTVLAGESGSGKTSLLRLCNRLDVPTSGQILFHGTDLLSLDPLQLRRRVGMVFQRPALFGGTVRDNLLVADPSATEEQLRETMRLVELSPGLLDRIGDDLSGGEAQRVCLGRTLLCKPEVLLMDEPTAALHPAARFALERTVQSLRSARSVDVLWVTHDIEQIERLAEHLIVLRAGEILYSGSPSGPEAKAALATLSEEESS